MIVLIVKSARAFVFAVHFPPLFQLKMYDFLVTVKSRTSVAARHSNVSGESTAEWSTVVHLIRCYC